LDSCGVCSAMARCSILCGMLHTDWTVCSQAKNALSTVLATPRLYVPRSSGSNTEVADVDEHADEACRPGPRLPTSSASSAISVTLPFNRKPQPTGRRGTVPLAERRTRKRCRFQIVLALPMCPGRCFLPLGRRGYAAGLVTSGRSCLAKVTSEAYGSST
jgi:hypothetical protein